MTIEPGGGHGLADGFLAYLVPSQQEYSSALQTAIVALDANVLLNAYRYHPTAREDLFTILEALGDRLFIPHQSASEYWTNRESTVREAIVAVDRLEQDLEQVSQQSVEVLNQWAKRSALSEVQLGKLRDRLNDAYTEVLKNVGQYTDTEIGAAALDTSADPVLFRLLSLLRGQVGAPFSSASMEVHSREAQRRIDEREPPGYKDSGKSGTRSHGDYLLWRQVLDAASDRQSDVVLVTGDLKEDWWRREHGETRGPRIELAEEFARETGHRLFMLRPASLIERAKDALSLAIQPDSVDVAERVDRYHFDRGRRDFYSSSDLYPLAKLPHGRTADYLETLIQMCELAQDEPDYDEFIERFQETFPAISVHAEARRRVGVLVSLGLAQIDTRGARLTEVGNRLLDERDLSIVQEQFMERIAGAGEIRQLAVDLPLEQLRGRLRDDPPTGISPTQASLVLRYMEQLGLL
ncbi:hypothetical protein A5746_21680 [Mycolicibacterium conceptionense]|uniref:PIN-like domain-containing protein n=1 Tax=Mycobacteriaceae TaxID=1762 RepID=UPI00096CE541|nr:MULTISPECIES: PIN domain-containing protein [Mycobacteriaceae]OMB89900.1 hypothetical protein A5746_21680 [Mycolicibacterium conceptionense]SKK27199.1 Uncharacterised protein [Mycobacteroides abscessus subsp. massiliense]